MRAVSVGSQVAELNLASLPYTLQLTLFCLMQQQRSSRLKKTKHFKNTIVNFYVRENRESSSE